MALGLAYDAGITEVVPASSIIALLKKAKTIKAVRSYKRSFF